VDFTEQPIDDIEDSGSRSSLESSPKDITPSFDLFDQKKSPEIELAFHDSKPVASFGAEE
jgi:hypothetical protein